MILTTAGDLRGANVVREAQGNSKALSQVVVLGNDYRLRFRLHPDSAANGVANLITAAVPGRRLDKEIFGRSFIVLENVEETTSGKIVDKTGLDVYQRIGKVLFKAKERWELVRAERDAKQAAEDLNEEIDKVELAKKIQKIKEDYEGDKDHNPPIYSKFNPPIGGQIIEIATECLVIPMDANGAPKMQDATIASLTLNSKRTTQLLTLLDNPAAVSVEDGYLEVSYSYKGETKNAAGMAATFQNVSADLRLDRKFPALAQELSNATERLAKTPEIIAGRNFNMNSLITAEEVASKLIEWASSSRAIFIHIDFDAPETAWAAQDFLDTHIMDNYDNVREKLKALVDKDAEAEEATNTAGEQAALNITQNPVDNLRTVQDVVGDIDAASEVNADLDCLDDPNQP